MPVFRSGPHGVKKALQWVLARVSGHHVQWHALDNKSQGALQKSTSTTWSVENDDLADGIRFINTFAPECDALNEQTFWILANIKPDSGTPVAGWPEVKVRAMCQNKSRGISGAASHNEFPLNTSSLNSVLVETILPLVYPPEHSHPHAGEPRRRENPSHHHNGHGHWPLSHPPSRPAGRQAGLETGEVFGQFQAAVASDPGGTLPGRPLSPSSGYR